MPRKRKEIQPKPTYSRIGVKVEDYDARVEADINIEAKDAKYAIELDDRDPVYKYITRLTIVGTATYPEDRAGHRFEITVFGDESPSRRVFATLKDIHERERTVSRCIGSTEVRISRCSGTHPDWVYSTKFAVSFGGLRGSMSRRGW